jgi:mono/diheme cytochrome c family protein
MGPVTKQIASLTLKDDLDALSATELQPEHQAVLSDLRADTLTFPKPETAANQIGKVGPTRKLTGEDNRMYNIGKEVFLRDAHCATCHQPNGQGIANVYPSLVGSAWLKDDERLIKLALKGLWGPIEVNGQRFDPSKGVPPMTGFGGLLNDMELAAVLTFVRQSWGNDLELVDPDTVRKVRAETKSRANFYMADELLKEHPFVP